MVCNLAPSRSVFALPASLTRQVLRNIGGVDEFDEPGDIATGRPPYSGHTMVENMLRSSVKVFQVAFWDPTDSEELARTSRAPSCPDFIDVDDNYTLLLHQGRIERAFSEEIELVRQCISTEMTPQRRKRLPQGSAPAPVGGVYRSYNFISCRTLDASHDDLAKTHPVEAVVSHADGVHRTIRARYLLGNDGARSMVRRWVAGGEPGDGEWKGKITMQGEGTDIVWGVMDAQINSAPSLTASTDPRSRLP